MLATIAFNASRARSRSSRSAAWWVRVWASSSLTERSPRADRPCSKSSRIASHWPRAHESFSDSSDRLAASSAHNAPSWSNRRCRCCNTASACWHSASIAATCSEPAPGSPRRRVAAASASARRALSASRVGSAVVTLVARRVRLAIQWVPAGAASGDTAASTVGASAPLFEGDSAAGCGAGPPASSGPSTGGASALPSQAATS